MANQNRSLLWILNEIKLGTSRLSVDGHNLSRTPFIAVAKGRERRIPNSPNMTGDQFSQRAGSAMQSYKDTLNRICNLKEALAYCNSKVEVDFDGGKKTVAQLLAIRKLRVHALGTLITTLRQQLVTANTEHAAGLAKLEAEISKDVSSRSGSSRSLTAEEMSSLRVSKEIDLAVEILDPLKIEDLIARLHDDVQSLDRSLDLAIQEANAKYTVPVDDKGLVDLEALKKV